MNLQLVWQEIESKAGCHGCSLEEEGEPLVLKPDNVDEIRVLVITEGPNKRIDRDFLTSVANHPTYTFLFSVFGGKFRPVGKSTNSYWTHVRKCFINGDVGKGKEALNTCSEAYLESEIESLEPRVILSVGNEALKFLSRYDKRLKGKLTEIFKNQTEGIYEEVLIDDTEVAIAVVPHPRARP
jgi:uracil-DNA glycosylase